MPESASISPDRAKGVRIERIPFESVPDQSKLFLEYLNSTQSLSEYYPNAVDKHDDVVNWVPSVLANYSVDREIICSILDRQNNTFDQSRQVFANIELLRQQDCVAVITGQQAGLFTGPLYTIYKAISVIRSAARLRELGVNAVPVFWIATEDHDLEEVSSVFTLSGSGQRAELRIENHAEDAGRPVGSVKFGTSVEDKVNELFAKMPKSEFSPGLRQIISGSYRSGRSFGTAFGKLMAKLFESHGLILFDPMDEEAKRLAAPIYRRAVERTDVIIDRLTKRSEKLISEGFHAQVVVEPNYFPLFWLDSDGVRRPLRRIENGRFRAAGTRTDFSVEDLIEIVERRPQELSPGVMLRPVVQDHLFPALCYFGGAAEIAYFAQNSAVYEALGRPVTPILPRQSFTIVETRHSRTMKRYGIEFIDLFNGIDSLRARIVAKYFDPNTDTEFIAAKGRINAELDSLHRQLSKFDPTLTAAFEKRQRKILFHISATHAKFQRHSFERAEMVDRQFGSLFDSLLPGGTLQERSINFSPFANRYGKVFMELLETGVDLNDHGHKALYL